MTPRALPHSMKASTALLTSSMLWAAESCTRMRAWPLGTTYSSEHNR